MAQTPTVQTLGLHNPGGWLLPKVWANRTDIVGYRVDCSDCGQDLHQVEDRTVAAILENNHRQSH